MARKNGHLEWESSKHEQYAETWWTQHGFTWELKRRFVSYSGYAITKDNITVYYEIPNNGRMDIKKFMEGIGGFTEFWKLNTEYQSLLEEAKAKGLR